MDFAYGRVSTTHQNLDRQIEAFKSLGIAERNIYVDKESGATFDRPNYLALKNSVLREGDTLVVKELDRLGRDKMMIKEELQAFKDMGVRVKILNIPTTCIEDESQGWILDMITNILIEVLASIAEEERIKIHQRQKEGIRIAKQKGIKFGRPAIRIPDDYKDVMKLVVAGEIPTKKALELLNLKKGTYYNMRREYLKTQGGNYYGD